MVKNGPIVEWSVFQTAFELRTNYFGIQMVVTLKNQTILSNFLQN
jgi:hypothetical protein